MTAPITVARAIIGAALLVAVGSKATPAQASLQNDTGLHEANLRVHSASPRISAVANPIAGATFWVNPASNARIQANQWRESRPADASQLDKIAANAQAKWFGGGARDIERSIDTYVTMVGKSGATPVLVAYNIPQRDCGGLSGGGGANPARYREWISGFAQGLGGRRAIVILEPDAIANMDCLSAADRATRIALMRYAVQVLKAQGRTTVYLDGGNPRWQAAREQAARLTEAGVASADGFALNVSNFFTTAENVAYGSDISALVDGKHFVIDTSRNGVGPADDEEWCNPGGRALGTPSTTITDHPLVDALLWIKAPGESDGACGGDPKAGEWWAEYALGLAAKAGLSR